MKPRTLTTSLALAILLLGGGSSLAFSDTRTPHERKAYAQTSITQAIGALFGHTRVQEDPRVILMAPQMASGGASVPVRITTTIPAKRIALFQDANPTSLVNVWQIHDNSVADYEVKIKLRSKSSETISLIAIVEGRDGRLYMARQNVHVALGGCDDGGSYVSSYTPPPARKAMPQQYARAQQPLYSQPQETSSYAMIHEGGFKDPSTSPLSTFSIDVDTASYSNVRHHITDMKRLPPNDAVRIEEMVNYFDYDYEEARDEKPFYINTRVGSSLWNSESRVIQIGLQTQKVHVSELPQSNLVFLLDVSGSMYAPNKLPLLIQSLKLLVAELRPQDRVSIVVYAGRSGLVLDRAYGNERERIYRALDSLSAGGSTAGGAGIRLAYDVAQSTFIPHGNNRVILATDGDFNVGVRSQRDLTELIERKREHGIYLSVLGFGNGNLKDDSMELLADKGNGNYAYIDSLLEAKKVLVTQMSGTLYTVAKDVKIQVEFNPAKVESYRLIGYENRVMANEDFHDDTKDAGEIGMGHRVTALYEIIPAKGRNSGTQLKYQRPWYQVDSDELATVKIRYKDPKGGASKMMTKAIHGNDRDISKEDFLFAQSAAGFGMLLRESEYAKGLSFKNLISIAKDAKGKDREGYRSEMIKMMEELELMKKGLH